MRSITAVALSLVMLWVPVDGVAQTATAFYTGERDTGFTTQCFYDYLGDRYTHTIGFAQLCPLSIQVRVQD